MRSFILAFLVATVLMGGVLLSSCKAKESENGKAGVDPALLFDDPDTLVQPDPDKHLQVKILDSGKDIFQPVNGYSYRYGPSMLTYKDGSMDAWFATPGTHGEWDWLTYRHIDPATGESSDEVAAVQPTGDSWDRLSCCDPGAVYFGGYYYLGYTSTVDIGGVRNNVFIARSRTPDGPYEKWNGSGWGGDPYPVIYYDGSAAEFGAGEPAMVTVGGKIYLYYTWKSVHPSGEKLNQLRVSVGDAANENWPATLVYKGVCYDCDSPTGQDSADVKYVENYGKFLAVCTDKRFTDESRLAFYESDDGITFTRIAVLRTDLACKLHNCGISSRPNGHINTEDNIYVAYAYGSDWGVWATRLHGIEITLGSEPDFSDENGKNADYPVEIAALPSNRWTVGVTSIPHAYRYTAGSEFNLGIYWTDITYSDPIAVTDVSKIRLSGYDRSVISINGVTVKALKPGTTFVTAEYDGRSILIPVRVYPEGTALDDDLTVTSLSAVQHEYRIDLSTRESKQIRLRADYAGGSWMEIYKKDDGVTYSGYDTALIRVSPDGMISSRKTAGETEVTVSCGGQSITVKVICE